MKLYHARVPLRWCEAILACVSARVLEPSKVGMPDRRRRSPIRTSSSVKVPLASMPPEGEALSELLELLTGLALARQEPWEGIRYEEGQGFGRHHDGAHRAFSAVLCLRAPVAGGELEFTHARRSFSLRSGELLVWSNRLPDGSADPLAEHCAHPVAYGEKWSLVTWVRP